MALLSFGHSLPKDFTPREGSALVPVLSHTHSLSKESEKFSSLTAFCKAKLCVIWTTHCSWSLLCGATQEKDTQHLSGKRRDAREKREIWEGNVFVIRGISHRMQTRKHHYSRSYFFNLIWFIHPPFHILLYFIKSHRTRIFISHLDKLCYNRETGVQPTSLTRGTRTIGLDNRTSKSPLK